MIDLVFDMVFGIVFDIINVEITVCLLRKRAVYCLCG